MTWYSEFLHRRYHLHTHICSICGKVYKAYWVYSGYPHLDDCCCVEFLCKECEDETKRLS
jgi:hypothetical protein